jgi:ribosome-dependent ATPase
MYSYLWRETLELQRDPVRATLALGGSLLLMFVMGFGISMDVEDLRYAVLDRDQTTLSQNYALNLAGSRYFPSSPPLARLRRPGPAHAQRRTVAGHRDPPGFARDVQRGQSVQIGAWIDGAMPQRAETVQGYVQGMHQHWLAEQAQRAHRRQRRRPVSVETRFRYNPDVKSLPAMVPAVIPMLLLMLPAMLTALAVVREKELGSIINLYVTPVTRSEFLLGKQLPYVGLAMVNFLLMSLLAVTVFGVPVTGSFARAVAGRAAVLLQRHRHGAAGLGRHAQPDCGHVLRHDRHHDSGHAVRRADRSRCRRWKASSRWIGEIYPASHMFTISRGVFSKALGLADLAAAVLAAAAGGSGDLGTAILLLKKQER